MTINLTILPTIPFKPRGMWVVIHRDPDQDKVGSLALPDTHKVKMARGTVLAVGSGMVTDSGFELKVTDIKPGDVVQWAGAGGNEIKVQGQNYTFVPAQSIVLVETSTKPMDDAELENKLAAMSA